MGTTHDDVIARMAEMAENGKKGKFLSSDTEFGLALSASDTAFRGVTLIRE